MKFNDEELIEIIMRLKVTTIPELENTLKYCHGALYKRLKNFVANGMIHSKKLPLNVPSKVFFLLRPYNGKRIYYVTEAILNEWMKNKLSKKINTKKCPHCKKTLDISDFHRDKATKDGFYGWCKECENKQRNKWYKEIGYKTRREKVWTEKITLFQIYSNGTMKCALCDNDDIDVLVIDHINGGGTEHRKKVNGPDAYPLSISWYKTQGYPEGYRLLCRNCNWKEYLRLRDREKSNS